ncbi:hypothetical protein D3C87_887620 [compost metagenome]
MLLLGSDDGDAVTRDVDRIACRYVRAGDDSVAASIQLDVAGGGKLGAYCRFVVVVLRRALFREKALG